MTEATNNLRQQLAEAFSNAALLGHTQPALDSSTDGALAAERADVSANNRAVMTSADGADPARRGEFESGEEPIHDLISCDTAGYRPDSVGQEAGVKDTATLTPLVPVSGEPFELFDGWAVYQEIAEHRKVRTSPENVSDVLDAVVRLIRKRANPPHALAAAQETIESPEPVAEIVFDTQYEEGKLVSKWRPQVWKLMRNSDLMQFEPGTKLFAHPPHALATRAEVKRLREALTIAEEQLRYVGFGTDDDAVHTAAEAARAALSTPADTSEIDRLVADAGRAKWQPIETAPKDGTMFLCWVSAERYSAKDGEGSGRTHDVSQVDFCWWRRGPVEMPDAGYFDPACGQIGDAQDVTHWMPLPDAPDAARAEVKS